MSRNRILARLYFIYLSLINLMYVWWLLEVFPLPFISSRLKMNLVYFFIIPMALIYGVFLLFDRERWFRGICKQNYHTSEQWKELYPLTYRLEQSTIFVVRNSWKYFLLLAFLLVVLSGTGILS